MTTDGDSLVIDDVSTARNPMGQRKLRSLTGGDSYIKVNQAKTVQCEQKIMFRLDSPNMLIT